jgi:hypothetical protein
MTAPETLSRLAELLPVGWFVIDEEGRVVIAQPSADASLAIQQADPARRPRYVPRDAAPAPQRDMTSGSTLLYQRVARLTSALRWAERLLRRTAFTTDEATREEVRRVRQRARHILGYRDEQPWKKDPAA